MVPSGPPTPLGGVPPSLLRSNSGLLGAAGAGSMQQPSNSLISPRAQFNGSGNSNNMNILGNISSVSSLLNHSMVNGGPGSAASLVNLQQRGGVGGPLDMLGSAEPDPLSFNASAGMAQGQQQFQSSSGNQQPDHSQPQQIEAVQNFQKQFPVPQNQYQQQQVRGGLGAVGSLGPVKLEPQMGPSDQNNEPQQLQALRGIGSVKLEPQQLQSIRSLGPVKLEHQHSDSSLLLQQQQQQQQQHQFLQMSRQSPQAAAQLSLLQQQRIMQFQQQQQQQQQRQLQQQLIKAIPPRTQLQQQLQQSLPGRPPLKPATYEPGTCAQRLTQYMYSQKHRPEDNNIEFWRKFVAEYFAPTAKKRWCVSLYGNGRQTTGVFPQDVWHCEICNRKPGRGFETTAEVLPRLMQIKYASGTLEELLYVDMPRESHNALGQIVLDYAKAIQESVFDQLRVVRDGHLRIVFNPDLKISSWEFCARRHEELIPRRLIIPQVSQLGTVVQKYQNSVQSASSNLSAQDLQNSCNSFVASARQLAKALEVPLVNDLGYTKRYVRCLQISEVVNSMKDLIDYSRETGTGPMDSLINFPRRTSGIQSQQSQQPAEQQTVNQNSNHNNQNSGHAPGMQLSNGIVGVNSSLNSPPSTTSAAAGVGLLHQNSMSRQEHQMGGVNSPYAGGNTVQMPSPSPSSTLPPSQPNPSSPFPSPTPSLSNNNTTATSAHLNSISSPANISTIQQKTTQPHEPDPDSQSSVQQILQEMMMSSQMNGAATMGNEMKGVNGITPGMSGSGVGNSSGVGSMGFGSMGGVGPLGASSGLRAGMVNNAMTMNGRVGMNHMSQDPIAMNHQQQQDMGNRLLGGLGSVNSFSSLQFDWKPSP